jgi:hypothetical protein
MARQRRATGPTSACRSATSRPASARRRQFRGHVPDRAGAAADHARAVIGGRFHRCEARLFEVVWSNLAPARAQVHVRQQRRVAGRGRQGDRRGPRPARPAQPDGRPQLQNQCDADYADQVRCFATPTEIAATVTAVTDAMRFRVFHRLLRRRLLRPRQGQSSPAAATPARGRCRSGLAGRPAATSRCSCRWSRLRWSATRSTSRRLRPDRARAQRLHGARPDPQLPRLRRRAGHQGAQAGDPGSAARARAARAKVMAASIEQQHRRRGAGVDRHAVRLGPVGQGPRLRLQGPAGGRHARARPPGGRELLRDASRTTASIGRCRRAAARGHGKLFDRADDRARAAAAAEVRRQRRAPGDRHVGDGRAVHAYPGRSEKVCERDLAVLFHKFPLHSIWRCGHADKLRRQARGHRRDGSRADGAAGEQADLRAAARRDSGHDGRLRHAAAALPRRARVRLPDHLGQGPRRIVEHTTKVKGGGKQTT